MKSILLIFLTLVLFSCTQQNNNIPTSQNEIDSLKEQLVNTYKPGFGEFMGNVQAHHIKLWFAGSNENWKLADFEVHEIIESMQDIEKYQTERPESKMIRMIYPALDSVNAAIQKQDQALFKNSFILLTHTCNDCHRENDFEFNVVKIPDFQPFSNQVFKTKSN